MGEDGAGPADPVGVFMSGVRLGGNISPTGGGSFPGLLEKGDVVANLVDSSPMGKRIDRPLLSRGNTGSSLANDLGVLVLDVPCLLYTSPSPRD